MNKRVNTTSITFRLDVGLVDKLDELCMMTGVKRGEFFAGAICAEYDKIKGNPELSYLLEQMRSITETVNSMMGKKIPPDNDVIGQVSLTAIREMSE